MKTKILILGLLLSTSMFGQKLVTRTGFVKFYSHAPIEDIEAVNNQVSSVIDTKTGEFAFLVPIKGFVFEKALMQEHFNENYMESGQYPKGSFEGKIADMKTVNWEKDGTYPATFKGKMTIHGQTKEIEEKAEITIASGAATLNSKFHLRPEDYGVKIPASKKDNIADKVEVTVKMNYDKK